MSLFPEYCWKDTALGSPNKRNVPMRQEEIGRNVPTHRRECYTTWARFADDFRDYVRENQSVKGFKGKAYSDYLWLDVDAKDENDQPDPEKALEGALRLVLSLTTYAAVDEADLRIYFSGAKGFHIGIPAATFGAEPSEHLPAAFKILAKRLAEQAQCQIDGAVYDMTRLWRLPNTANGKTGLYKVALTWDDFEGGIEGIRALAQQPRAAKIPAGPGLPNDLLASFYQQSLERVAERDRQSRELPMLQPTVPVEWPKHDKVCIARLMQGVTTERNNAAIVLAVNFRQKGMSQDLAEATMQAWNLKNRTAKGDPNPLPAVDVTELVQRAYENGYDFGCHNETMDAYCHETCHLYPAKIKESATLNVLQNDILTISEAEARYLAYTRERDLAKVTWGIPWLDQSTRQLRPGQVGMVLARAGVGKTALVNKIVGANSLLGIPSLFCSLEQLAAEVYERMAQSVTGMDGLTIEDGYYSEEPRFIETVGPMVAQHYAHAYICDKDRLTADQLKAYVRAAETKAGQKIRLLCVDYLGRMRGTGKDKYEKIGDVATSLKNVAKECELAVIVVVQLNRAAGSGKTEVEMEMARDSGEIEESADVMVGMWRAAPEEKNSALPVSITTAQGTVMVPPGARLLPDLAQGAEEPERGPRRDLPADLPGGRDALRGDHLARTHGPPRHADQRGHRRDRAVLGDARR
jgi:hypothetical protein